MDRAEQAGLGVAGVGHAALFAALSFGLLSAPKLPKLDSQPVEVTLATEVDLQSASPAPAPPVAAPAQSEPAPAPIEPAPAPIIAAPPPPPLIEKPQPKPEPKPVAKSEPAPKPSPKAEAKPKPIAQKPARPATASDQSGRRPDKPAATTSRGDVRPTGALDGLLTGASPKPTPGIAPKPAVQIAGPPAADLAAIKRALGSEIARQLKPRWTTPTGAEVDQLVTILSWDLAKDGGLSGEPRFVSQGGVTPSNNAQARIHRENAIKAVRAAAPFRLPPEHYAYWKAVISFRFDKRLSQ